MEEKKNNKKIFVIVLVVIFVIIAILVAIFVSSRNSMTPEETVSRFMYLIENKEYEEAKKLTNGTLEKLDTLSKINPSSLNFKYSDDKTEAVARLLEEEVSVTDMYVNLEKTIFGWKIQDYEIISDMISPQEIEDKLKLGKEVTSTQFLYWGISDCSSKDEIAYYAENNILVATIFVTAMQNGDYDKAYELYDSTDDGIILSVEKLKEYNWEEEEVVRSYEPSYDFYNLILKLGDKQIIIHVSGKKIFAIAEMNG